MPETRDVDLRGAPPREIGRYIILGKLGAGATATVYSAYDPDLDRRVAIKVIDDGPFDGERQRQLIIREAKALARLRHANVVSIYDAGTIAQEVFIVMELVSGVTLRDWLDERPAPRSWRALSRIFLGAAEGLAAAHAAGLTHRDFKPSNVVISESGDPRILDFGLAIASTAGRLPRGLVGTPAYMALEQLLGGDVDPRSDQFSYCASLYEALYGVRPFTGTTVAEITRAIASGDITSPQTARGQVPRGLHRALLRGLALDPADRFADMDELLAELRRCTAAGPRARRAAMMGGALIAAASLTALAVHSPEAAMCANLDTGLEVWTPQRQINVHRALSAKTSAGGEDSWRVLSRRIDGYVESWSGQRRVACEETHVQGVYSEAVLDRRMACLDRQRAEFDTLLMTFIQRPSDMNDAIEAVNRLPSASECEGTSLGARLTERIDDPERRAAVERFEPRVIHLKALDHLARNEEGLSEADALLAEARALEHAPTLAEVLFYRGRFASELGKHTEAEESFWESLWLAEEAGDDALALRAAGQHLLVLGVKIGRIDEAMRWRRFAAQIAGRPGSASALRSELETHLAEVAYYAADFDQAESYYRSAEGRIRRDQGDEAVALISVLTGLAAVLRIDDRDLDGARAAAERALGIAALSYGDTHPLYAKALKAMGDAELKTGTPELSENYYLRALAVLDRGRGTDDPLYFGVLNNLGVMENQRHQFDSALAYYQRALELAEERFGPDHMDLNASLYNIGNQLRIQGRLDESIASYKRILAIHREHIGELHPSSLNPLRALIRALIIAGEDEEEIAPYVEMYREILDRSWSEASAATQRVERYEAALRAARELRAIGRNDLAVPYAESAYELARTLFEPGSLRYQRALVELAKRRFDAADLTEAARLITPLLASDSEQWADEPELHLSIYLLGAKLAGEKGDVELAQEYYQTVSELVEREDPKGIGHRGERALVQAMILDALGEPDDATETVRTTLDLLRREGHGYSRIAAELSAWLAARERVSEGRGR